MRVNESNREGEGRVDKRLQPRHLHSTQSEPAQSGKIIKIRENRGSNLLLALIHAT